MKRLIAILMAMKEWTYEEALDKVLDARLRVIDGANAEAILEREFQLDSSYIDGLVA